jgi:hypothetical protein
VKKASTVSSNSCIDPDNRLAANVFFNWSQIRSTGFTRQPTQASATLHGADEAVHPQLSKAGRWLLQVSSEQIQQLSLEAQQQLKTGLRMVLEVIVNMRAD